MIAAMDELACGHGLTLTDARLLMGSGFPWDQQNRLHYDLCDLKAWWDFREASLIRAATLNFQSVQTAGEKPHPQAFARAKEVLGN